LLPLAEAETRWPVSTRVSTTDATLTRGGATAFWSRTELGNALYWMTEQKGCRTRLHPSVELRDPLLPAFADVEHLIACGDHHVTRSLACRESRHINLQEIDEVIREVEGAAEVSLLGERMSNGVDSTVTLGAWGKGRSGSPAINRALQGGGAWQVFNRKMLSNFRLGTKANPSDDPSRLAELRKPEVGEPWAVQLVRPAGFSRLGKLVALFAGEIPVPCALDQVRRNGRFGGCRCLFETGRKRFGSGWIAAPLCREGVPLAPGIRIPSRRSTATARDEPRSGRVFAHFEAELASGLYTALVMCVDAQAGEGLADIYEQIVCLCSQHRVKLAVTSMSQSWITEKLMRMSQGYLYFAARVARPSQYIITNSPPVSQISQKSVKYVCQHSHHRHHSNKANIHRTSNKHNANITQYQDQSQHHLTQVHHPLHDHLPQPFGSSGPKALVLSSFPWQAAEADWSDGGGTNELRVDAAAYPWWVGRLAAAW